MIKRDSKKGQEVIGMSIGTIFSIFIIIVIIAVAVYVIVYFLGVNRCANVGFFYEELQNEIDKAWTSGYKGNYEGRLVSSGVLKTEIEEVCFGNLTASESGDDRIRREELERGNYYNTNANVFMYPGDKVCGGLASKKVEHVKVVSSGTLTDAFFCVNVKENDGIIRVKLIMESRDSLVRLEETA